VLGRRVAGQPPHGIRAGRDLARASHPPRAVRRRGAGRAGVQRTERRSEPARQLQQGARSGQPPWSRLARPACTPRPSTHRQHTRYTDWCQHEGADVRMVPTWHMPRYLPSMLRPMPTGRSPRLSTPPSRPGRGRTRRQRTSDHPDAGAAGMLTKGELVAGEWHAAR
jgi:hypothetical protein